MTLLFLFLGLAVGSFINALAYRINPAPDNRGGVRNRLSIISGRSICPDCRRTLAWWQLVPVFSYLVLGGRCHYCRKTISPTYPLVELITGLSFAATVYLKSSLLSAPYLLVIDLSIISLLVFIALYDYKEYLILDAAIFLGVILAALHAYLVSDFKISVLSGLLLCVFFGTIYFFSKGSWIGLGDVKLGLFLGLFNGALTVVTLSVGSWVGAIFGIFLILLGRGNLKTRLPFGTLLSLSAVAVFLAEDVITRFLITYFFI